MPDLDALESSLSPSSPGRSLPSTVGSHFYLVRLLISRLSTEDADNRTLWETQSLNISFYVLQKKKKKQKNKALKALAMSLTLRLFWSWWSGATSLGSLCSTISMITLPLQRDLTFGSLVGIKIYEKCFCFPQIRVQEIKTLSRQV